MDKIILVTLTYDKTKNDVEEIKRLRKIVKEAASIVKETITKPGRDEGLETHLAFTINNSP